MKVLKIIPLTFVLMLAACGGSGSTSSSQTSEPSSEPAVSSEVDLFGFEFKKDSDNTNAASYNLANQITLKGTTQLSDLQFTSVNTDVATVDASGLITRVAYGSTQIAVSRKDASLFLKTFTINFLPDASAYLGKYDSHMAEATGHESEQVLVTIEIKENNKFTLNYSAGWLSAGSEPTVYHIESPIAAEGTFELDSLLKFTVTTTSFPYKKTFSGIFLFDSDNTTIKAKVPVAADKTSNMTYFEKVVG